MQLRGMDFQLGADIDDLHSAAVREPHPVADMDLKLPDHGSLG